MTPVSASAALLLDAFILWQEASGRMAQELITEHMLTAICDGLCLEILKRSELVKPIGSDATPSRSESCVHCGPRCRRPRLEKSYLTVFEELDLAQTFLRFFERFIWSAEILSLARQYLVAIL